MKITVTVERVEDNKYHASLPISEGGPMIAEGDSPGEALSDLGGALDVMLVDSGWDELEKASRKPAR